MSNPNKIGTQISFHNNLSIYPGEITQKSDLFFVWYFQCSVDFAIFMKFKLPYF